jgi:hypothetical protein
MNTYMNAWAKPDGHGFQAGWRAWHAGGIQLPHDAGDDYDYGQRAHISRKDLEAVLRKIEYWHQAPITKFRIMARQGQGDWHGVRWDGKTATSFPLNETDENEGHAGAVASASA